MSKQVDERVVSMQFDNKNFEQNVQTSMSTLDKLKQKLNFKNSAKGFDELGRAAKNVDMSVLDKSVEAVKVKFSALQVVGVTALANITNEAVNAGKKLVKSLSIDQVTAGWNKYEQKTASVQTIMNATGKSIDDVNKYLQRLMDFSDETSYGFTDMTAALGQMTSSGGDIDKLIPLITGVANATAYAGKGATEFSRVMYNLNQSYGAGHLQLMDWKSLELAGVGSKQLKETLIDTAVAMGKISEGSVTVGSFAESLKDKWADRDVMEAAFGKFSEYSQAVFDMVDAGQAKNAGEAMDMLEDKYGELGIKAFKSAQEAKSFTEAIDATKDAVSSQWMRTMELLFGNYEQAKKIWTDLADALWDIFAGGGEDRNALLEEALNYSPVSILQKKLEKVAGLTQSMTNKLLDYSDITNRIIAGEFGVTEERWNKLTEMGYDWMHAQNLVNEKLGDGYRYATNYNEAQERQTLQLEELTDAKLRDLGLTEEEIRAYRDLEAESKRTGKSINELLASMKEKDGRTLLTESFYNIGSALKGSILAVREAFSEIFPPMTAVRLYNLIKKFSEFTEKLRLTDKATGELNSTGEKIKRTLKGVFAAVDIILTILGGPVKLVLKLITKVCAKLGGGILNVTANVGDAIVAFRDWIDKVLDFDKIFRALGNFFRPFTNKVKEWIKSFKELPVVQNALNKLKKTFAGGINAGMFTKAFAKIGEVLKPIGKALVKLGKTIWELDAVQAVVQNIKKGFVGLFNTIAKGVGSIDGGGIINTIVGWINSLTDWLKSFNDEGLSGENLIDGLGGALSKGVSGIVKVIKTICEAIYNTFCKFFDIHSPSKVMITLGGFLVAGLAIGISKGESELATGLNGIFSGILNIVKGGISSLGEFMSNIEFPQIKWEHILAIGGIYVSIKAVKKMMGVLEMFGSGVKDFGAGIKGFSAPFTETANLIKDFREKAFPKKSSWKDRAHILFEMAAAIGILAASIYVLSKIEPTRLWIAVGAVAALAVILGLLMKSLGKIASNNGDFGKATWLILSLSASMWIMASAIKKLDFINDNNIGSVFAGLIYTVGSMVALMFAIGKLTKGSVAKNIDKASVILAKIAGTILLLTIAIRLISWMNPEDIVLGTTAVGAFSVFIAGLIWATKLAGKSIDKAGVTIAKIGGAIALLAGAILILSWLDPAELVLGIMTVGIFGAFIVGLIAATKLAGKSIDNVAKTLMGISGAMTLMALTCRIVGGMDPADLVKGIVAVAAFGAIVGGLIWLLKGREGEMVKCSLSILAISVAIGMLAALSIVLSLVSLGGLAKGVTAISILTLVVGYMVKGLNGISEAQKTILQLTICLGVLVAAVLIMTFIDPVKLAIATASMATILGLFAVIIKTLSTISSGEKGLQKAMKSLYMLSGVMVIVGAVLAGMSLLSDPAGMVASAVGLSLTLMAMVQVLTQLMIMAKLTSRFKYETLMKPILMLTAMVIPLIAFAGAFALIGMFNIDPMPMLKLIGIVTAIVPLVAGLAGIGKIPGAVPAITQGLIGLGIIIAAFAGVALILGAIQKTIGGKGVIEAGFEVLSAISYGIGNFMGSFIQGMGDAIAKSLPGIGDALGKFMEGATPFFDRIEALSAGTVAKVGFLTAAIMGLTAAGFLNGLAHFLPGGGIVGMAEEIGRFAVAIGPFLAAMSEVKPEAVEGALLLAKAVIALTAASVLDGIANFVPGKQSLEEFAEQFAGMAKGIVSFAKEIDSLDDTQLEKIESGANALKTIAKAASDIPNTGGMLGGIVGDNDAGEFAKQFKQIGKGIRDFLTEIGDFGKDQLTTVEYGAKSIKAFAKVAEDIPNSGGFVGWITGNNDIDDFANKLPKVATGIKGFITNLGTFGKDALGTAERGAKAIKAFAKVADEIPNSGTSFVSIFVGDNNIDEFANRLPKVGEGIKGFADNIGSFEGDKYTYVKNAVSTLKEFAKLTNDEINSSGVATMEDLSEVIPTIGENMAGIAGKIGKFGDKSMGRTRNILSLLKEYSKAASGENTASEDQIDDMTYVSEKIPEIAENMTGIAGKIGEFGDKSMGRSRNVLALLKEYSNVGTSIVGEDKSDDMVTLSEKIPEIAENMSDLYDTIGKYGKDTKSRARNVLTLLKEYSDAGKNIVGADKIPYMVTLSENIPTICKNMKNIYNNVGDLDDSTVTKAGIVSEILEQFAKTIPQVSKNMDGLWDGAGGIDDGVVTRAGNVFEVLSMYAGAASSAPSDDKIEKLVDASEGINEIASEATDWYGNIGKFGDDTKGRCQRVLEVIGWYSDAAKTCCSEAAIGNLEIVAEGITSIAAEATDWYGDIGEFGKGTKGRCERVLEVIGWYSDAAKECCDVTAIGNLETIAKKISEIAPEADDWYDDIGKFGDGTKGRCERVLDVVKLYSAAAKEVCSAQQAADITAVATAISSITPLADYWYTNIGEFGDKTHGRCYRVLEVIKLYSAAAKEVCSATQANTLVSVATGLTTITTHATDWYDNIGEFGDKTYGRCNRVLEVLKLYSGYAKNACTKEKMDDLVHVSQKIKQIGTNMKGLDFDDLYADGTATKVAGVLDVLGQFSEDVNVDTAAAGELATLTEALTPAIEAISEFATNGVSQIKNAYTNSENISGTKTAVVNFVSQMASAASSEDMISKFKTAGLACAEGFGGGISSEEGLSVAEIAGTKLGKKALEAAKAAIDSNSPSKKFAELGLFSALGLALGITKNTGEAVDATVGMANALLKGFQDELEIHSPSLVMNEQGHYIVQGVAEGITADMSAEEAAKQKAQNIVDAFDEVIQNFTRDGNIADKSFQLWELTDGLKAAPDEKRVKQLESLNKQMETATSEQRLYYDQWQEMQRYHRNGQVGEADVDDAYEKWYDSQIKAAQLQNEINELIAYGAIDESLAKHQQGRDVWQTNYDTWLATEGRFASETEQIAARMQLSQANIESYRKSYALAIQKHAKTLERSGGIVNDEVLAAWNDVKNFEKLIGDEEQNVRDIMTEASVNAVENVQERMDLRNKELDLWRETDGLYATGAELEAQTKKYLEMQLSDQTEMLDIEERELARLKSINATEESIAAQEEKVLDAKIAQAQTQNQINDIAKTAIERQREAHELASETADLQYQIWENTTGREATSAEKDIAKIGVITKQLSSQAGILNIARDEYKEACRNYGKSSNEAQAAYNAYLQEQLNLATLQNEIIDIEKKTTEKQKLAKSEYKDYVEKYKKFYELNGMSVAQLEKDAKLVSGYDPNNTVENLVSKTQRKLDDLMNSSEYTKLLDSFSSVGTSYISAINDGVDTGVSGIMVSLNDMLNSCQEAINERADSWEECAMSLIDGFIKGITDNIKTAVEAATKLAIETEKAVREEFDINSPSKVFADISSYAVLGLAKGFTDNCSVSAEAAAHVGDAAVEAMRNTISRISEVVDSDMDTRPTISPVLDLTDVKTGVSTLNSMFSRSQAMDISASMAARAKAADSQNGADKVTGGNTYHFEQNNYSPKALSRMDIYRQTKNQFAAMKGATS